MIPETHDVDSTGLLNRLATLISREIEEVSRLTPEDEANVTYKESLEQVHLSMLLSQMEAVLHSPAIVSAEQRKAIVKNVDIAVVDWLKRIFGIDHKLVKFVLFHGGLNPSTSPLDHTLIPVLRSALYKSFSTIIPSNLVIPVVYTAQDSSADEFEATVKVCWPSVGTFLGLQNVIVRRIPCLRHSEIMDVGILRQIVSEDLASGNRRPCLVVAKAGTPVLGQVDDLKSLRSLADSFGVWLHVSG